MNKKELIQKLKDIEEPNVMLGSIMKDIRIVRGEQK